MDTDRENGRSVIPTVCPHCQKPILLVMDSWHAELSNGELMKKDYLKDLSPEQLKLLEYAQRTNLVESFRKCVAFARAEQIPKSIERFFITIMRTAVPKAVPRFALERFMTLCGLGVHVEFYTSQGIGIVVGGGQIRAFVPTELVLGKKLDFQGAVHLRPRATEADLDDWLTKEDHLLTLGQRLNFGTSRVTARGGGLV